LGVAGVVNSLKDICDWFAVATEEEAAEVRKLCKNKILLLSFPENPALHGLENVFFVVTNREQAKLVPDCYKQNSFVKFNCGMNRLGFDEYIPLGFEPAGVLTHFFTATPKILSAEVKKFQEFCSNFSADLPISCKASSTLNCDIRCDIARVGFELYADSVALKSQIAEIRELERGDYLGYGDRKVAKNMRIAIVSCGYGDGLFRNLGNNKYAVKINEKSCKIVHNVCMDYFFCDISKTNAKIGDVVTIIENRKDLQKMATAAGTIEYEILTAFSQRLQRIYAD